MAKIIDLTPKYFPIIPAKEKIELPVSFDDIELSGIKTGNLIREINDASKLKTAAKIADCIVAKSGGDYTSIQAALDNGEKNIFIKKGTYEISSPITIMSSGVTIKGESHTNTIIKLANGANCHGIVIGDGYTNLYDIIIEDIQIDGNKVNNTGSLYGIYLYGAAPSQTTEIFDSTIRNCVIKDFTEIGIATSYVENILISDNLITGNPYGLWLANDKSDRIIGNIIRDNTTTGLYLADVKWVTVSANNIKNNTSYEIYITGGEQNTISGNSLGGPGNATAIYATSCSDITITGNQIFGSTTNGIHIDGSAGNVVSGNTLDTVAYGNYGIYLQSSHENIVIGNHVRLFTHGIFLASADKNIILGNRARDNNGYGINISDTTCDDNLIVKNYLQDNIVGAINDAGTGTILVASTVNDNVV